jgi:hypothetical protein
MEELLLDELFKKLLAQKRDVTFAAGHGLVTGEKNAKSINGRGEALHVVPAVAVRVRVR